MNGCLTAAAAAVGVCDAVQLGSQSRLGWLRYLIPCGCSVPKPQPTERSGEGREAMLTDLRSTSFRARGIRLFSDRFCAASSLRRHIFH